MKHLQYKKLIPIYRKVLFCIGILCANYSFAQERLTVSTTENATPCVMLKWFDEQVIYPEGINIYRTDVASEERLKLNSKPIKKGDYNQELEEQIKERQDEAEKNYKK